ncbi:SapC family protein [Noviherbaspirillum denitrificans]|uniref:Peptidase n=1 Tax=Noviherbaspirillum denitrificans TaxID=1968433 RepID=A0A254T9Z6_9BURK|nr:SapC family protein [Noviherbaspirillum denitrificans]OWW18997.1 peptidase [Noviherbaspirillum denitrificans]
MPKYQAISKTTFGNKFWRRYDSYVFAAKDLIAPLVMQEIPRALMHLPIGFVRQGDRYQPVAVLGFETGENLFVAQDGRWLAGYIPAAYRGYPFQLATTPDGEKVLVVDEESGLVNDVQGEPFFDSNGNPAKSVTEVLGFLMQVHANKEATDRVCGILAEQHLIQPWPITVQEGAGERKIEGLYCIDEAALNALPLESLEIVRRAGALPLAYCQLLSMQHLHSFSKLAEARAKTASAFNSTIGIDELDLAFLNDGDTIRFSAI